MAFKRVAGLAVISLASTAGLTVHKRPVHGNRSHDFKEWGISNEEGSDAAVPLPEVDERAALLSEGPEQARNLAGALATAIDERIASGSAEQKQVPSLSKAAARLVADGTVPDPGPSPCVDTTDMSAKDRVQTESLCKAWKLKAAAAENKAKMLEKAAAFNKNGRAPVDASTLDERQAEQCRFDEGVWQEYAELHRQGLRDLASGSPANVLVWRCESVDLCGGNTDQLSGILKTFLLAVQTKRVFLVDWYRSEMDMEKLFPQSHIQWKFTDAHRQVCQQNSSSSLRSGVKRWPGDDDSRMNAMSSQQCLVFQTNMDPERRDSERAGLDRYRVGCYFHYLFGTSELLRDTVQKRHPAVSGKQYAAVHIRMGDWWMDSKLSAQSLYNTSDLVLRTMLDCSRNMSGTEMPVMVYADAYCVKALAQNSSWLGNRHDEGRVFTTTDKNGNVFVPSHTDDGHNNGLNGEKDWIPDPTVMQEKLLNSWADQFGIMGATHLIKSSWSGFSKMAAEIALMDPKSVRQFYVKGDMDEIKSVRCDVLSKNYSSLYW